MIELRNWKKVVENDLESLIYELKEFIETPSVIILTGEVGAGKTTFTQRFCQNIQAKNEEEQSYSSPSYSLINEYGNIVHADFYRIEDPEEITHLEIPLYLDGRDYFFVEWGSDYLSELKESLEEGWGLYELKIHINPVASNNMPTRNYTLLELD